MRNPGHEEWWGYSPMILPMYSKVLFGYVLTILHLKLVSQCDRPHVHLMHTPIRTFLCWLVISEMVSLFGRVSQFSKTSTIFVAQIAPQLNHPVPVSPTRSQVGLGQPWKLGPPFEANTSWAQLEIFGESTPAFVDSCEMLEKALQWISNPSLVVLNTCSFDP